MPVVFILFKWLLLLGLHSTLPFTPQAASLKGFQAYHPYFISVTQIEFNNPQKTIEISCKLFADDFEMALKKVYNKSVDFSSSPVKPENAALINEYILKRLSLELDGRVISPQYLGFEKEGEAVYVYFEGRGINSFKKLDLRNSIMQEYTDEQINIVHVLANGKRQSSRFTHRELTGTFSF